MKLAGVGSSGFIVIDPPENTGDARFATAQKIAAAINTAIAPRKPAKAPAKPVAGGKAKA